MNLLRRFRVVLLILCSLLCTDAATAQDQPKSTDPPEFKDLKYRPIGPAVGGRVARACGVPGDPLTYYAATAAGGVWKSADGGVNWKPVFDDQPISTIGSIAVAPSDPNVVYVGSGEANIRGNVEAGNGIYKSTDAGKTWKHVWKQEGQIGTMIVHPRNPEIAFAAVLGHAFGPNPERGVYRTRDGGKSWQKVLFRDNDTGASDVCFDPTNPRILFAGLWQARRKPWEMTSGGPGSGLYVSRDGGDTWTHLVPPPEPDSPDAGKDPPAATAYCEGLPKGIYGKVCVAVAPSDGRRVYAMIENEDGGLFRSDDGGETWKHVNGTRALRQRAWYFSTVTVHPTNPDVVICPNVPLLRSIDGGKSFQRIKGQHHGDHHDVWIDPKNPRRMIDSNDGGVDITTDGGETWYAPPLPICQFYHIAVDNRTPYHVSGAIQDIGTASGPSNSLSQGGIAPCDWHTVGGGEAGFTAPDPSDPNIVYAGEYGGYISRYDHRTRQAKSIGIYPYNASGHDPSNLKYRFQWTAPILVSQHDPKTVYHGANVLFKTTDGGMKWAKVSDDLTRNDKTKQKWSGGPITGDNTGVEVYDTIFALAESPMQKDLFWVGSDDGLVHVTKDGGKNWTKVTPKELPEWATVTCIEPSPFDAGTAYVVADAHRLDDMKPYLFKTNDFGKTWKSLTTGLAPDVYLRAVREDPKKRGQLYVGTERGVMFSTDDGATWKTLKLNLPTVAVSDLRVKDNDLVVGTNGRSIWILDDLTPLRETTPAVLDKEAYLFTPEPAFRWRYHGTLDEGLQHGAEKNPPAGVVVNYHLKKKPKGDITLEVLDAKGNLVRKLTSKEQPAEEKTSEDEGNYSEDKIKEPELATAAGLHRVVWDLRYEGAELIKKAKTDGGEPKIGPLAIPGTYTLKLTVEGKTLETKAEVKPDPRTTLAAVELEEQLKAALQVRDDITRLTRIVEQLRSVRRQIVTRNELLKDDPKAEPLVKESKSLLPKLDALEEQLHNPKAKVSYDILGQRGGAKLYSQLAWLFEGIKDADGAPTQGWRELYEEQVKLLDKLGAEWKKLVDEDIAKLNEAAKKLELPGIVVPRIEKRE